MTRIISGTFGGRTIDTPPGSDTRPTTERVREALFSALQARDLIAGSRVLDLYAGSGALGLEAASRGAADVTFVERDRRAAAVIRANISSLGAASCRVVTADVATYVSRGPAPGSTDRVELALLDPPYDIPDDDLAGVLAALTALMSGAGTVVVERTIRAAEPRWPDGWTRTDERRYGETVLWWARVA